MIYELSIYKPHTGKAPFEKWLTSLKDKKTKQIIQARIDRAVFGNLGDIKGLGEDVFEFRIDYGPGFGCIPQSKGKRFYCLW
jgi:putative addiction module killer protein